MTEILRKHLYSCAKHIEVFFMLKENVLFKIEQFNLNVICIVVNALAQHSCKANETRLGCLGGGRYI